MLPSFSDGIWLVEFAPIADSTLVPSTVLSVLGVKAQAGGSILEALTKHVRDRQMLLILDLQIAASLPIVQ